MEKEKHDYSKIESVGDFIKVKRIESGLSQGQLGKKLGFSNGQFISNIERGLCSIPLEKCKLLCEALNISKAPLKAILSYEYTKKINRVFDQTF